MMGPAIVLAMALARPIEVQTAPEKPKFDPWQFALYATLVVDASYTQTYLPGREMNSLRRSTAGNWATFAGQVGLTYAYNRWLPKRHARAANMALTGYMTFLLARNVSRMRGGG
jgi:hypothetical protein